ncbi:MAG: hypothetical protein IJS45_12080 [Clostridia bacterium]|nr:hypothetical protein [Clostridia bacterium]
MENENRKENAELNDSELSEVAGGAVGIIPRAREMRRCANKGCNGLVPSNSTGIYCKNCAAGKPIARL